MFSTPQSKAFFSQQIIKGKLIAEQIQLANYIYDRIWESKNSISQLIKLLQQPSQQTALISQKTKLVEELIEGSRETIQESNEQFQFEVSLRNDIKGLQHAFFKHVMIGYEEKIKDLKHGLLLLENDVQSLEQKGLLPYIQNPQKNNVLSSKSKNFIEFKQKLQIMNEITSFIPMQKFSKIIVALVDSILQTKQCSANEKNVKQPNQKTKNALEVDKMPTQELDKSFEIKQLPDKAFEEVVEAEKPSQSISSKGKKNEKGDINEMLRVLQNWGEIVNFKLKRSRRDLRGKIQAYSHGNRVLKQGIRNYKKIMKYEQNESNIRYGLIQFTREQAIDFLHEMNQDLQRRFTRRNIYMVVSLFPENKLTKSCTNLKYSNVQKDENASGCLRELDTNLNNSFLDQCSYLISDRFIVGEDQNQEVIV